MITGVIDTETTGNNPDRDAVIEIALVTHNMATRERRKVSIAYSPMKAIHPDATAVHGYTNESVKSLPPMTHGEMERWNAVFNRLDLVVAHNLSFDVGILATEAKRQNYSGLFSSNPASFCTMMNGRWAGPEGKMPRLGELCYALSIPYDENKAHSALYDTEVTMDAFLKAWEFGFWHSQNDKCDLPTWEDATKVDSQAAISQYSAGAF